MHIAYLIAHRVFSGTSKKLDVIILNGFEPKWKLTNLLSDIGVSIISANEARNHYYEVVFLMPNNILFANTNGFLSDLKYVHLYYCADGFRNGLHFDPNLQMPKKVVYWGFFLREKSFWDEISFHETFDVEVVPIQYIADAWRSLLKLFPQEYITPLATAFRSTDCLVILRHWGTNQYGLKPGFTLEEVVSTFVGSISGLSRVVVRGHPNLGRKSKKILQHLKVQCDFEKVIFEDWDETYIAAIEDDWILNPEALIINGLMGAPGRLVAFDSSINALAALYLKNTAIVWPDFIDEDFIFLQD